MTLGIRRMSIRGSGSVVLKITIVHRPSKNYGTGVLAERVDYKHPPARMHVKSQSVHTQIVRFLNQSARFAFLSRVFVFLSFVTCVSRCGRSFIHVIVTCGTYWIPECDWWKVFSNYVVVLWAVASMLVCRWTARGRDLLHHVVPKTRQFRRQVPHQDPRCHHQRDAWARHDQYDHSFYEFVYLLTACNPRRTLLTFLACSVLPKIDLVFTVVSHGAEHFMIETI